MSMTKLLRFSLKVSSKRKEVQSKYIDHMKQVIEDDDKINDLIDWENSKDVLEWLDSL
jgi:hypothetical protein